MGMKKTVATFQVKYPQFLKSQGEVVQELPQFAHQPAKLIALYRSKKPDAARSRKKRHAARDSARKSPRIWPNTACCNCSLTFDHRAPTGGEAARFLAAVLADLQLRD